MKALINLCRIIFKQEPTIEEKRHQQYVKSLNESTTHFNGVKVNEMLLGKIQAAKMDDCVIQEKIKPNEQIPIRFENDVTNWLENVRNEAKLTMNKNHQYEKILKAEKEKAKLEKQQKAAEESRNFFKDFGLLPKHSMSGVTSLP